MQPEHGCPVDLCVKALIAFTETALPYCVLRSLSAVALCEGGI